MRLDLGGREAGLCILISPPLAEMSISVYIAFFSMFILSASFVLYPLILVLARLLLPRKKSARTALQIPASVSFVVCLHNVEQLIVEKLHNIIALDFGDVTYEVIIYLDGCTDQTLSKIRAIKTEMIKVINEPEHLGKNSGINRAVAQANGDILIFTDADALLEPNVVSVLLTHFSDPRCGGVCGLRTIKERQGSLRLAQKIYIAVDSQIKKLETYLGNITSNEGKLFAVRRCLFKPIADAVTDDLYQCLNIAEQHYHFVFEPRAIAHISTPSRNSQHEYSRRRRIVTRSLNGIWLKRKLLNPLRYGCFSVGLLLNKVIRRLIGVGLLVLFGESCFAQFDSPVFAGLFYAQLGFYLLAIAFPLLLVKVDRSCLSVIRRLASICWYFCLGNYATLLGVIDFLRGKRVSKWIPQKHI